MHRDHGSAIESEYPSHRAIDKPGAVNARLFAVHILATTDQGRQARLEAHRETMAKALDEANAAR